MCIITGTMMMGYNKRVTSPADSEYIYIHIYVTRYNILTYIIYIYM